MKHNHIGKVLGWADIPDVKEGLHLQPEEASKIDECLGKVSANETAVADLVTANEKIETLEAEAETAATNAQTLTDKVTALQSENDVLKSAKPSGSGTKVAGASEEHVPVVAKGALPKYDSPDHPANKAAEKYSKPAATKKLS
jgi:uncharacterized phage infection (PIP) family protein YhgE